MKTFTEIDGFHLREVYGWMGELLQARKAAKRQAPVQEAQPLPELPPPAALDPPTSEATPPKVHLEEIPAPVLEAIPPPAEVSPPTLPKIKSPEERYAEFLKRKEEEARRRRENWLATMQEIKEPLSLKMKEKFQWPDERIKHAFLALDVIDRQQVAGLKRIVVLKPDKPEEPLPKFSRKVDEFVYLAEYFPTVGPVEKKEDRKRPGKRKFRSKRSGPTSPQSPRSPRSPRTPRQPQPTGPK